MTHMTEFAASRDIVAAITGRPLPQVLVRVGWPPPSTPYHLRLHVDRCRRSFMHFGLT